MTVPPLLIEAGTTNLLPNPSAAVNLNGWTVHGEASATVTRDTTQTDFAPTAIKVVTTGAGADQGVYSNSAVAITQGQLLTVSTYAKGGGTVTLAVKERNSSFANLLVHTSPPITLTGTRTRYSMTFSVTSPTAAYAWVGLYLSGAQTVTYWCTDWQLEEKDHATGFTVGTRAPKRAPGFLTLGSPHIGPLPIGKR